MAKVELKSSVICVTGKIQDNLLNSIDKSSNYDFDGWIEFNPNFDGISVYYGNRIEEKPLFVSTFLF